jgi:hypothetical protein
MLVVLLSSSSVLRTSCSRLHSHALRNVVLGPLHQHRHREVASPTLVPFSTFSITSNRQNSRAKSKISAVPLQRTSHSPKSCPKVRLVPRPQKCHCLILQPIEKDLVVAFARALQAHEESGDKIFTEEEIHKISKHLNEIEPGRDVIAISLDQDLVGSPQWKQTVIWARKLINVGAFQITKEHLESMNHLDKEAGLKTHGSSGRKSFFADGLAIALLELFS